MGIVQMANNHHWNHFLMLDSDTIEISRFIEFTRANYRTYSLELARLPNLKNYPVRIARFGLKFKPWTSWSAQQSPKWWEACNRVKHHRDSEFPSANLKNALNAVAGLFVMLLYAFPNEAQNGNLHPRPQLFSIPEAFISGYGAVEDGTPIEYRL